MVGGIHGSFTGKNYLEYLRAVKDEVPEMHVHAFTPLEVWQGARTLGMSVEKFLVELKEAGLGTLPGTAAEVLDDEVRAVICPTRSTPRSGPR
jgi:FO synthase